MKNFLSLFILLFTTLVHAQNAGTLDASFGDAGKVFSIIGGVESKANGVAVQTDGKIIVVGYAVSSLGDKDFATIRLNSDGGFDTTFGTNGIVLTDLQNYSDDVANSVAIQADGFIVIAGESQDGIEKKAALIRLDTTGNLDSGFNASGIVLSDWIAGQQDAINILKFHLPTGNLIVGGYSELSSTVATPILARYTSAGQLDTNFNSTGIVNMAVVSGDATRTIVVEDIAVKANGIISAVGWRRTTSTSISTEWWAGRVLSNGSMDNTFSIDGVLSYDETGSNYGTCIELLSNDNLLVSGYRQYNGDYSFRYLTINSNGNIPAVSTGFIITGSQDILHSMLIDPNGNYILAGSSGTSLSGSFILTRLYPFGAFDVTFGSNGLTSTQFVTNNLNQCNEIILQTDQKIIAVGFGGQGFAVSRYLGVEQTDLNNFDLISPATNSINQPFTSLNLDWSDATGADGYIIERSTDETFTTLQSSNSVLSQTTLTNLTPNTLYYWRVKAYTNFEEGEYVGPWSFTTVGLNNFTLQLPANNAINIPVASVSFNWTDVAGATGYQLQLATDNTFSSPQTLTSSASTNSAASLASSTVYYWRVRATLGNYFGDWSTVWSFTTAAPQNVVEMENLQFNVYPNPAQEYLELTSNKAISDEILIIDNQGRVVITDRIYGTSKRIDVSQLANGFYTVQLKNQTGAYKLFVVER